MFIEFKQGEKHAGKGADTSPFHEPFQDAGYLLEENDLIVDIDNLEKSKIKEMIRIFNIGTQIVWTDRGAHLYFKKPNIFKGKSEAICPLGFKVEYKTIKNTPNGITIKREGKLRDIENMGQRQELPDFLYMNKNFDDLLGLDDGDGRNSKLHSHKFKIMTLDDYKKVLRFINSHVFADSLNEDEFTTVSRDEELKTENMTEYDVAINLIKKLKIHKYCNVLYVYNNGRYEANEEFKTIIKHHLAGRKMQYVKEVLQQIEYELFNVKEPESGWDVKFKNGIIRNGQWIPVDSQEFTPHYIDLEYKEDAEPVEIVDKFLNGLTKGDENYKKYLLEMIALCYITNPQYKRNMNFQKAFFIIGDGGNGKGTFFNVMKRLLGIGNYSPVKLNRFDDERYLYSMKGKLANLGDDIENKPLNDEIMSNLKGLTGYDEIQLRKLFDQPTDTIVTATQVFTTNHLLKSFEKGHAWKRRAVWMPVYNKVTENDPKFNEKLMSDEALQYWLKLVMDALDRLVTKGDFTKCQVIEDYTNQYHQENNSCLTWVKERKPEDFIDKRPPEVYNDYEIWALENEGKAQTPKTLKATIESEHGLQVKDKKVNGRTAKVYAPIK